MKQDEEKLLRLLQSKRTGVTPREIIPESGIHPKRAWFILGKWWRKGWYSYGTTVDLGWLTESGRKA